MSATSPTPAPPKPPTVVTLKHADPKDERRRLVRAELRAMGEPGKPRKIGGYAIVYDQPSEELGWFVEIVRPGAATESLRTADVRCLFNHDANLILGRSKSGTLRLADDPKGLAFECDLPDTRVAADLAVSIDRKDVDQCSFGFRTLEDRWTYYDGDKPPLRELLKIEIYDVSPVTFPAYPQTDVAVRCRQVFEEARKLAGVAGRSADARRRELELATASIDLGA